MKNRIKKILHKNSLFLVVALLLTACFEIKEEVYVKNNGSGTYSFTLDMGQLKQLFIMGQSFQKSFLPDSVKRNYKMPSPLEKMRPKFDQLESKLTSINGISHYEVVFDTVNYIIGAKYDFASMKALNKAVNIMQEKQTNEDKDPVHYAYSAKSFERFNTISLSDLSNLKKEDTLAGSMLSNSKYLIIYKFDQKVKEYDNEDYFMSGDKKTLIYSAPLLDLIKGKRRIDNKVKF